MILPELRARSAFSFLEGASLPETLIEQAAKLGNSRRGLTGPRCHLRRRPIPQGAQKRGIRAWIGAEVTAEEGFRYPLIAATRDGLSESLPADHPRETAKERRHLRRYRGLRAGPVLPRVRSIGLGAGAGNRAGHDRKLRGVFPDGRVAIDIQRHFLREEEARNQIFLQMGLPVACSATASATPLAKSAR